MTALLLFPSIHYVLRAERILQAASVLGSLVPVPHDVSTECGMAWSMPQAQVETALEVLRTKGLTPDAAWAKTGSGWVPLSLDKVQGVRL